MRLAPCDASRPKKLKKKVSSERVWAKIWLPSIVPPVFGMWRSAIFEVRMVGALLVTRPEECYRGRGWQMEREGGAGASAPHPAFLILARRGTMGGLGG